MIENHYDAIVVGARCAGSPTAMLLARKGYRVLVVDRATFPSDTISTHLVHPPGVAALKRWGLLDRLVATGCPPIDTYAFDFGPFTISGAPGTAEAPVAYAPGGPCWTSCSSTPRPRREPRFGRGSPSRNRHRGRPRHRRSRPRQGRPDRHRARPRGHRSGRPALARRTDRAAPSSTTRSRSCCCGYYTYWSGLPMDGRFEVYIRPDRAFAAWPTHDDLTWSSAAGRSRSSRPTRRTSKATTSRCSSWRRPSPTDPRRPPRSALRRHGRAELLPQALRPRLGAGGRRRLQQGLHHGPGHPRRLPGRRAVRHRARRDVLRCPLLRRRDGRLPVQRDEHVLPMYEFTAQLATLEPPPPELQQLLGGHARQPGGDGRVRAGQRRSDVTGRVLLGRERRTHRRRGPGTPLVNSTPTSKEER